jgi:hypothetical protein
VGVGTLLGDAVLGRVVDQLGEDIDELGAFIGGANAQSSMLYSRVTGSSWASCREWKVVGSRVYGLASVFISPLGPPWVFVLRLGRFLVCGYERHGHRDTLGVVVGSP